jgi:hypothetical protein
MTDKSTALVPEEGWHCLHLFYRIEYGQWQLLSREEQNAAKTNLASLVQEVRAMDSTQLLTLSIVTPKADLGFMLVTPDLHSANKFDKQLSLSFGRDRCLTPSYSYLSAHGEHYHDGGRVRTPNSRRAKHQARIRRNSSEAMEFVSRANETLSAERVCIRRCPIGEVVCFII